MTETYFKLPGGLTATFQGDRHVVRDPVFMAQMGAYIPGANVTDCVDKPDFLITVANTEDHGTLWQDNHIYVISPIGQKLPDDLYHLLYGMVRKELVERGIYPIHAACVGKGDDFTLIVGHSGAGKTTLAHRLVEQHGLKLFSGNKTVVTIADDGQMSAIAGTRTMTALNDKQQRFAYQMGGGQYESREIVPITKIALVRVNDGVEEVQHLEPLSALHTLYPFFMDAVNSDVIVNGHEVFNGAVSGDTKTKLVVSLQNALTQIPVDKYSGPLDMLAQRTLSL
jgi:hypothetical protein